MAVAGINYNYFDVKNVVNAFEKVSTIGGKIALQASFQLNRKLSLFVEPSLGVQPKQFYMEDKKDVCFLGNLSIGAIYCFKDKYKRGQKKKRGSSHNQMEDMNEIKTKLNRLMAEMIQLKEEIHGTRKPAEGQKIVMEPIEIEILSVDIIFNVLSSFISKEQQEKLNSIGEWMQKYPTDIKILAFSDKMNNKNAEEKLREERANSIRTILTDEYKIDSKRIQIVTSESMGYENKTGSNAIIIYMPKD